MFLKERMKKEGDFCFRYRSYLPLLLVPVLFLVVYVFGQKLAVEPFSQEPSGFFAHLDVVYWNNTLIYMSLFIGILGECVRIFVAGYAAKNTSGRNTKAQQAHTLNTTGAYSLCRNPLYFGNFLMMLSPILLVGNFLFIFVFILAFWLYYERIIFAEEAFLEAKFGTIYTDWVSKTPCFVPNFKHYQKPALSFSFKTMICKEFHSIFALIVALWSVHYLLGIKAASSFFVIPNNILSLLLMITTIFYVTTRALIKRTQFFSGDDMR